MGVNPGLYDHLVTSGEMTFAALQGPADEWHAALGRNYFHLGPMTLAGLLGGLDRVEVPVPERADFVLNTGTDGYQTVDDLSGLLHECASHQLPMICANPDLAVFVGNRLTICAGALAARYATLGGVVKYHGKPHASAYLRTLDLLGLGRQQVLAVGDSLVTDIAGAALAGIDVAFVASGIHRTELGIAWGGSPETARLAAVLSGFQHRPTYVISHFKW